MIIEGSPQGNTHFRDWVNLVEGIRAGDQEADLRLRNIFQGGIRFFLRQGLGRRKLQSRQREVFSLAIRSIRESFVANPNRLASHVLTVLQQYIDLQMTAGARLALENGTRESIRNADAVRELLANIATVDGEALRRYREYKEASGQISRVSNTCSARLRRRSREPAPSVSP
jgi:hypothetical protein